MSDNLSERVEQFRCLELPGQPMSMHMGTSYLISDLWKEVERLTSEVARLHVSNEHIAAGAAAADEDVVRLTAERDALLADAERWRMFLSTRPPETHEAICCAIDAARSKT
jgi:hypothetical protein